MSPTFSSLRVRNYRLYSSGMVVSNVGTWMQRVAQDWLVLQLSGGDGVALGITTALQFLPMALVSPWGGALADRLPKRGLLMATNTAMAALAVLLGVLDLTGVVEVWQVYVLAFGLGTAAALDNPARQAFVSELVGAEDLPNAVGLNSASFNAARMVGPGLAGLLIVLVGTGPVFLLNALTFLGPLVALRMMRPAELRPSPPSGGGGGRVREGLRYVRGRPDVVLVLALLFVVGTFGLNFQMTTALVATQVFGKGAGEYGLLGSILAVGSLTGSLLAARRGRPRRRLVIEAALVFAVLEVAAGLMPTYPSFALSLVPVGVAALTFVTAANASVQLAVAPAMRGRVMALYLMVFMGGTPLGAPVIGWVGQTFGARWTLVGGGLLTLAGTLLATLVTMRRQGIVVRPHLRPRPHFEALGPDELEPTAASGPRVVPTG